MAHRCGLRCSPGVRCLLRLFGTASRPEELRSCAAAQRVQEGWGRPNKKAQARKPRAAPAVRWHAGVSPPHAAGVPTVGPRLPASAAGARHACCARERLDVCTRPLPRPLARSGVAEMAGELFEELRPHMEGVPRLHLAGHSLGGSLATLVALTAHLKLGGSSLKAGKGGGSSAGGDDSDASGSGPSSSGGSRGDAQQQRQRQRQPGRRHLQVEVTTFGSPPVLALAHGAEEDGRSILQARGPGAGRGLSGVPRTQTAAPWEGRRACGVALRAPAPSARPKGLPSSVVACFLCSLSAGPAPAPGRCQELRVTGASCGWAGGGRGGGGGCRPAARPSHSVAEGAPARISPLPAALCAWQPKSCASACPWPARIAHPAPSPASGCNPLLRAPTPSPTPSPPGLPFPPQDDPVPRALLSADPAFMALKSSPAVAGLLRLRERWLGHGLLSPTRFLYHPAGDVFLIRWGLRLPPWQPSQGYAVQSNRNLTSLGALKVPTIAKPRRAKCDLACPE